MAVLSANGRRTRVLEVNLFGVLRYGAVQVDRRQIEAEAGHVAMSHLRSTIRVIFGIWLQEPIRQRRRAAPVIRIHPLQCKPYRHGAKRARRHGAGDGMQRDNGKLAFNEPAIVGTLRWVMDVAQRHVGIACLRTVLARQCQALACDLLIKRIESDAQMARSGTRSPDDGN